MYLNTQLKKTPVLYFVRITKKIKKSEKEIKNMKSKHC